MAKLTNQQKREWAQTLYTKERLSQKEIAEKVNVSENTVGKWKNKYAWDEMTEALNITKETQLKRLYRQLDKLTQFIEEKEENQFPDMKEINTISQLTNTIQKLETEASVADIIEVGMRFVQYVRKEDWAMAQQITTWLDAFIQDSMN